LCQFIEFVDVENNFPLQNIMLLTLLNK